MSRVCCCTLPLTNPNACMYCSNMQQYHAQDYVRPFSVPAKTITSNDFLPAAPEYKMILNSGNSDTWSFAATT